MTDRMLDALLVAGHYLCYAAAVFPIATIRIGGQIGDDLRTRLDNRKKTT